MINSMATTSEYFPVLLAPEHETIVNLFVSILFYNRLNF
jgi:hypothetical protein